MTTNADQTRLTREWDRGPTIRRLAVPLPRHDQPDRGGMPVFSRLVAVPSAGLVGLPRCLRGGTVVRRGVEGRRRWRRIVASDSVGRCPPRGERGCVESLGGIERLAGPRRRVAA